VENIHDDFSRLSSALVQGRGPRATLDHMVCYLVDFFVKFVYRSA